MRSRLPLLFMLPLIAALALAAGLANAEPTGSHTWIAPVAGWIQMSNHLEYPADSLDDAIGFGARLGHRFGSHWGLELAGAYSPTTEAAGLLRSVGYANASANLMYTPMHWRAGEVYAAAGYGWSFRTASGFDRLNYQTFEQAIGWTTWITDHAGVRLEARNSIDLPKQDIAKTNVNEQQYWAGLTWAWGGKAVDTDSDGVPDRKDRCPGTPAGATVDATGCPHDADGDGAWDGIDPCPDTPKGATVDAKGCPHDADGDGAWDGIDQCPDTPKGATVDAKGCPVDSDSDGVWDGIDQCPGTPKNATVDARGCPIDSDGDGAWDGLDQCPNTPAGARVDAAGCPIEVTEKETELLDTGMIRLQGVNFETGVATLLPESFPILDQVGPILLKWPQLQIEIGGHTDSRGVAAKNQALSDARAVSVRAYLLQHFPGIADGQLTPRGYGSTRPVAPNTNALNMARNRRVEFVVLNKDVLKREVERRKLLQK
jgi:outer membrane protein OmpA-like peptidoglycan-associated protein